MENANCHQLYGIFQTLVMWMTQLLARFVAEVTFKPIKLLLRGTKYSTFYHRLLLSIFIPLFFSRIFPGKIRCKLIYEALLRNKGIKPSLRNSRNQAKKIHLPSAPSWQKHPWKYSRFAWRNKAWLVRISFPFAVWYIVPSITFECKKWNISTL